MLRYIGTSEAATGGVLRNFTKFTIKYLCHRTQAATLLKKGHWGRCFPENFAKFLGTSFIYKTSGDFFWYVLEAKLLWPKRKIPCQNIIENTRKNVNESNLSVLIIEFGKAVAYLCWKFFPQIKTLVHIIHAMNIDSISNTLE